MRTRTKRQIVDTLENPTMPKMTFAEALEALADERHIRPEDVRTAALRRKVWIAEWHVPGCLSESQAICTTKAGAIDAALDMMSGGDGPPRGARADLTRYGSTDRVSPDAYVSMAITTVKQHTLSDIL